MIKINKETRKVYDNLFEILYKNSNDSKLAYDHLLEFLAVDNCPPIINDIEDKLDWFFKNQDLANKLIKEYNLELIKNDRYDYLGDLYSENVISKKEAEKKGLYLTPQNVVEMMCMMNIGNSNNKKINILDPCVGTGRFLLTANKYAPNARLFGVDINITMVRTAFTNAAIQNISMLLLNADSLYHETDISKPEGIYNWKFANRWQSQIDKLKTITMNKPQKNYQMKLFSEK